MDEGRRGWGRRRQRRRQSLSAAVDIGRGRRPPVSRRLQCTRGAVDRRARSVGRLGWPCRPHRAASRAEDRAARTCEARRGAAVSARREGCSVSGAACLARRCRRLRHSMCPACDGDVAATGEVRLSRRRAAGSCWGGAAAEGAPAAEEAPAAAPTWCDPACAPACNGGGRSLRVRMSSTMTRSADRRRGTPRGWRSARRTRCRATAVAFPLALPTSAPGTSSPFAPASSRRQLTPPSA